MREIRYHRPTQQVPCNCKEGECGWVHRAYAGPAEYWIDGAPATKEEAKAAYYADKESAA